MIRRGRRVLAAVAFAAAFAGQASARSIVIDKGEFVDSSGLGAACTIGQVCAATTLPFTFNFGNGPTNLVYIYDRGIVSFGAPIPLGVDANAAFTTFGVPVIAPLYAPGTTGVAGPYQASSSNMSASTFKETLPNFGTDLFRITFYDPSADNPNTFTHPYIQLLIDASASEIRFEFIHGESFTSDGNTQADFPSVAGTQLGYSLGNQQVFTASPNIAGINAFVFPGNSVPEPATWMMMILGFGAIGMGLRRSRRRESAASA